MSVPAVLSSSMSREPIPPIEPRDGIWGIPPPSIVLVLLLELCMVELELKEEEELIS